MVKPSSCELAFCAEFGYPQQIQALLRQIVDAIVHVVDPVSILLFGSVARDEISYLLTDNKVDLLSDIEVIIVVDKKPTIAAELRDRLMDIETAVSTRNPLFHIDVGLTTPERLGRVERTIRIFDIKNHGKTIYGQVLVDRLPDVTAENLDKARTRELVLVRLANQLFYIPKRIVWGTPSEYECMILRYVSARNILDIPTILLALSGELLGSYRARADLVREGFHSFDWANVFGDQFVGHLEVALRIKAKPDLEVDPIELYAWMLQDYENLLRYLCHLPSPKRRSEICASLLRHGMSLLEGARKWKWIGYEAVVALQTLLNCGQLGSLKWLTVKKREAAICFLLYMHAALLAHLDSDIDAASRALSKAAQYQRMFALDNIPRYSIAEADFANMWLDMRRRFVDQFIVIMRFSEHMRRTYAKAVKWCNE